MKAFQFFKDYGDKILFTAGVIVLASILINATVRRASRPTVTNLVFTYWTDDRYESKHGKESFGTRINTLIHDFEQRHSDIKITRNETSYEDLRFQLFNSASPENLAQIAEADVFAIDPLWLPALQESGIIDHSEDVFFSFINVLYYNIDLLKHSGFSMPPKTRLEFTNFALAIAEAHTDKGIFALALALADEGGSGAFNDVYPWIWAGGTPLVKDGAPFATSPPVIDALTFLAHLYEEALIAPDSFSTTGEDKLEAFINGSIAFMLAPAVHIGFVRERMGNDAFGITSIPSPAPPTRLQINRGERSGRPYFALTGWTVAAKAASAHAEQARLFVDFLVQQAPFLAERSGAMPGPSALLQASTGAFTSALLTDPFHVRVLDIAIAGEAAKDFSGIAVEGELGEIFLQELALLFKGSQLPNETAASIQRRWQVLLELKKQDKP